MFYLLGMQTTLFRSNNAFKVYLKKKEETNTIRY